MLEHRSASHVPSIEYNMTPFYDKRGNVTPFYDKRGNVTL